jgi:DNA-binding response OmpR family regulator
MKILVVDDDPDIAEYIGVLLEDQGYEVRTADCTSTARSTLEEFAADAVIIDVLLKRRSGLDLLVSLRRDPRWSELPLIVITGNDKVLQDGGASYLASHEGIHGADAVLGKPLDPDALLATLTRLVRDETAAVRRAAHALAQP